MKKIYQTVALWLIAIPASLFAQVGQKNKVEHWFPKFDFNPAVFQKPPLQFAPFARWWWPGNNVDKVELQREINLFADNDFGGVEIQPMASLFAPGTREAHAKMETWDTPDYYDNLKVVMEEARKRGITVDMTDGSGWPPGGYFLSDSDGFLSLESASIDVTSGAMVSIKLPTVTNNTTSPSRLEAVIAAKTLPKKAENKTKTVLLDPSSIIVLTQY